MKHSKRVADASYVIDKPGKAIEHAKQLVSRNKKKRLFNSSQSYLDEECEELAGPKRARYDRKRRASTSSEDSSVPRKKGKSDELTEVDKFYLQQKLANIELTTENIMEQAERDKGLKEVIDKMHNIKSKAKSTTDTGQRVFDHIRKICKNRE